MRRAIAAVAVFAAIAAVPDPVRAQPSAGRILVMPFENVSRDARIVWLGEASSVLLADDLNALGAPQSLATSAARRSTVCRYPRRPH